MNRSRRKKCLRIGALLVACLLLLSVFPSTTVSATGASNDSLTPSGEVGTPASDYSAEGVKPYAQYTVLAQEFLCDADLLQDKNGMTVVSIEQDDTVVQCNVSVAEAGLYHIRLNYVVKDSSIHRTAVSLQINGAFPFDFAQALELDRPWGMDGKVTFDKRGNQILPSVEEQTKATSMVLCDAQGRYNEPLYFPMKAGENTLALTVKNSNINILSLDVFNEAETPTYEQLKNQYAQAGLTTVGGVPVLLEAENFSLASDSTVSADFDKSDACTSPNHPALLYYNIVPGSRFQQVGQWVEWQFSVETDGLYAISFRTKQDTKSGVVSTRRITVDGKALCKEMEAVTFPYSSRWDRKTIETADGEVCRFYFEAGRTYTIRVEIIPGSLDRILRELDSVIYELNSLYRSVVMVAGTDPDKYRDYKLASSIPDFKKTVRTLKELLISQEEMMIDANDGKSGSELTAIRSLINRLGQVEEDPDSLARTLSSYKSDVESLSAWLSEVKNQPVDLDYIAVYSAEEQLPEVRAGFFEGLWFGIRRLWASYSDDYAVVGEIYSEENSISVWISGGRDQLDVMKKLVDNKYSPVSQNNVNLALISASIREAVLAGEAPDVALFLSSDEPVNYAMRNAVVDLRQFDSFEEVCSRFDEQSMIPFMYKNGCYGVPLTVSFSMMFVRTDILQELGVEAPNTWEEMYSVAAVLQRKNIEIGIPSNLGMFATLLFQNGGAFFNEDSSATAFGSDEAVSAFRTWTSFFSRYGFPVSYDFYNRFRSGEMPIGIAPYTTYTMLETAAPEISGRWVMLPIPGTLKEDGSIDRSLSVSYATGTGMTPGLEQNIGAGLIFATSKKQEQAWEFLDWFTTTQTQVAYAEAIEAVLGPTARYATANKEAFELLPWEAEQREQLLTQMMWIKTIPEIPGNYYVTRGMNNAFRKVIYDNSNPVDTLNRYNVQINKEITRKQQQLKEREK